MVKPAIATKKKKTTKMKRFSRVPIWVIKMFHYKDYGGPVEEWLRFAIVTFQDLCSQGILKETMSAICLDEDMLRFCLMIDDLRELNMSLFGGSIPLKDGSEYIDDLYPEITERVEDLRDLIKEIDGSPPAKRSELFHTPAQDSVWLKKQFKYDIEFDQAMPIFVEFTKRLQSFQEKEEQLNLDTFHIKNHTRTISDSRISCNTMLCLFWKHS